MRKIIGIVIAALICIACIVLGIVSGFNFDELQKQTLVVLAIVCGSSAAFCFIVGEITGNNSQMDKLWSVLPIAYTWIIAGMGGMKPRLLIFAIIVTLWGVRLTINFGRKGAYSIKFWTGREDYRWEYLRKNTILGNRFLWGVFDLFFISCYQNFIVLIICLPAVAVMSSDASIGAIDIIVAILACGFLVLETVADENQWKFHERKRKLLSEGKQLSELPAPYNKGFNTTGVWSVMRHPNYLGEQGMWAVLYFFVIGAEVTKYGIFNWSILGAALLILLFLGSSTLGEKISSGKYPEYKEYQAVVFKYLPIRKYKK